jgi:hypothetical protein
VSECAVLHLRSFGEVAEWSKAVFLRGDAIRETVSEVQILPLSASFVAIERSASLRISNQFEGRRNVLPCTITIHTEPAVISFLL